jgi:hypothetical protein
VEVGDVGAQQPAELRRHRLEDLARQRVLRHERRQPPERRLLLGEDGTLLLHRRQPVPDRAHVGRLTSRSRAL